MTTQIEYEAEYLARNAHVGQVDKGGKPYISHCLRVVGYVRAMPNTNWIERSVAWLHDVVEDTDWTLDDLSKRFPSAVTDAVDALTRRDEESNRSYVERVAKNEFAVIVKRADYLDNMDPHRMKLLPKEDALRLLRVMADSQYILGKAILETVPALTEDIVLNAPEKGPAA